MKTTKHHLYWELIVLTFLGSIVYIHESLNPIQHPRFMIRLGDVWFAAFTDEELTGLIFSTALITAYYVVFAVILAYNLSSFKRTFKKFTLIAASIILLDFTIPVDAVKHGHFSTILQIRRAVLYFITAVYYWTIITVNRRDAVWRFLTTHFPIALLLSTAALILVKTLI